MPHPSAPPHARHRSRRKPSAGWPRSTRASRALGAPAPHAAGRPRPPTLRDVQLALAREQGFDGWTALKRALEPDAARSAATLAQYDDMAEALLEAYRTGTPEAMERHYRYTWHRRPWSGMRSYVQLDLGKRPSDAGRRCRDHARRRTLARRARARLRELGRAAGVGRQPAGRRPARHHRRAIEGGGASRGPRARQRHELDLSGVRDIGDADLVEIGRLTRLERLDLSGTSITEPASRTCAAATRCATSTWRGRAPATARSAPWPASRTSTRFQSGTGVTDEGIALLHEWPVFKTWQGGDGAPRRCWLRRRARTS